MYCFMKLKLEFAKLLYQLLCQNYVYMFILYIIIGQFNYARLISVFCCQCSRKGKNVVVQFELKRFNEEDKSQRTTRTVKKQIKTENVLKS